MLRLRDDQWERIHEHFPEEHIPGGVCQASCRVSLRTTFYVRRLRHNAGLRV